MPGCSKGAQGLSVLPRVTGIFTGTTISPGLQPRQCGDRYAFRAGRNLPDKEFRYLRTVIVTAAVYRGFGSELAPLPLTFRHRAGVSPYTASYDLAETCVFNKQSPPPILCGPSRLRSRGPTPTHGRPFSRSYGANLPSSLAGVLPSALGYSPRPPVSVCGTVSPGISLRGFSWQHGLSHFVPYGSYSPLSVNEGTDLPIPSAYRLEPGNPPPGWPTLLRPPIAQTIPEEAQEY